MTKDKKCKKNVIFFIFNELMLGFSKENNHFFQKKNNMIKDLATDVQCKSLFHSSSFYDFVTFKKFFLLIFAGS